MKRKYKTAIDIFIKTISNSNCKELLRSNQL